MHGLVQSQVEWFPLRLLKSGARLRSDVNIVAIGSRAMRGTFSVEANHAPVRVVTPSTWAIQGVQTSPVYHCIFPIRDGDRFGSAFLENEYTACYFREESDRGYSHRGVEIGCATLLGSGLYARSQQYRSMA